MSTTRWSLRMSRALNAQRWSLFDARVGPVGRAQRRSFIRRPPPKPRQPPRRNHDEEENEKLFRRAQGAENETQHMPKSLGQTQQREQAPDQTSPGRNTQLAATLAESDTSDLVAEVRIPDDPNGILPPNHPALALLGNSALVIQRQIEIMNIIVGFEQANKYVIMDGQGQTIGYIAEQDHGMGSALKRQMFTTHRSFTTHIFDKEEREVLRIHRPFAWINSRIRIYDPVPEGGYAQTEQSTALQGTSANSAINQASMAQISPLKLEEMRIIGEAQQQWAPLRRKYNLFSYRPIEAARNDDGTARIESGEKATTDTKALTVTERKTNDAAIEAGMVQFAHVNEPFLSWDFNLRDEQQKTVGSVNRNFVGFARELFTDTGVYALRMDSAAQQSSIENSQGQEIAQYEREATAMTLDQRAVMLATAISIDFDYFSRHSGHGSGVGFMPLWFPGMGGGAAEGGAAGGAVGGAAGGAAEGGALEGAAGAAGRAGGAVGAGEGAIAGAGTMAGYEAMQRGAYGQSGADDASPTANEPFAGDGRYPQQGGNQSQPENDVWGEDDDPWGSNGPGDGSSPPSAGGEGGESGGGAGGWMDSISEFFGDD